MVLNQTSENFSHVHELADLVIGDKGRFCKALWFGDLRWCWSETGCSIKCKKRRKIIVAHQI